MNTSLCKQTHLPGTMVVPISEFRILKDFMPEWNEPTGDSDTMTIDWNTLMPVVEKIETELDIPYNFKIQHNEYSRGMHFVTINDAGNALFLDMPPCESKIKAVYQAVLEFIKWYNTQVKL